MPDIAEFLTARYDEEQRIAEVASVASPHWRADVAATALGARMVIVTEEDDFDIAETSVPSNPEAVANAEFIAANDPARVLVDLEAKRGVVRRYREMAAGLAQAEHPLNPANRRAPFEIDMLTVNVTAFHVVAKLLATPYADHPDYDPAWRIDA